MRTLSAALPLLLSLGSPALFGDQVAFKNGDRLTGAIVKSDTKNILIRTAVAGEVSVHWQEIQELRSDQRLHVGLSDGKTLVGRVTSRGGRPEITSDAGGKLEAPRGAWCHCATTPSR